MYKINNRNNSKLKSGIPHKLPGSLTLLRLLLREGKGEQESVSKNACLRLVWH